MKITTLENALKATSAFDARKMYSSATLEVMHLHLLPGEQVAVHVNPVDVVFCVIQGSVRLQADGENKLLNSYDVIEVAAGIERGLTNDSDQDLRVLVLKKIG
jgi:quercetin dioxygenase-like cupin family protein